MDWENVAFHSGATFFQSGTGGQNCLLLKGNKIWDGAEFVVASVVGKQQGFA